MEIPILPVSLFPIGVSLIAMEFAVPGLYLAALGAGAMASGLMGYLFGLGPKTALLLLVAVSAMAYLFMLSLRGYGKK